MKPREVASLVRIINFLLIAWVLAFINRYKEDFWIITG